MAQQRDQTVHYSLRAGTGANNKELSDDNPVSPEVPDAGNYSSVCNFGTDIASGWILVKPGVTNATRATPAYGQGFGWDVLPGITLS